MAGSSLRESRKRSAATRSFAPPILGRMTMPETLLELKSLAGGYGAIDVLFDVDLSISPGQVVALCGRNGMGKTSTVRAIMGALAHRGGDIRFAGRSILGMQPHKIARLGIGLVPEGRQLFPSLSVRE